jgi:hypothetical protein
MDKELSSVPGFQSNMKFAEFMKSQKFAEEDNENENEDEDEEEEGEDDDENADFNFLMNMMEAEIENMGAPSGPLQQILQQLGMKLESPMQHRK